GQEEGEQGQQPGGGRRTAAEREEVPEAGAHGPALGLRWALEGGRKDAGRAAGGAPAARPARCRAGPGGHLVSGMSMVWVPFWTVYFSPEVLTSAYFSGIGTTNFGSMSRPPA